MNKELALNAIDRIMEALGDLRDALDDEPIAELLSIDETSEEDAPLMETSLVEPVSADSDDETDEDVSVLIVGAPAEDEEETGFVSSIGEPLDEEPSPVIESSEEPAEEEISPENNPSYPISISEEKAEEQPAEEPNGSGVSSVLSESEKNPESKEETGTITIAEVSETVPSEPSVTETEKKEEVSSIQLVLPDALSKKSVSEQSAAEPAMITCPKCHSLIASDSNFCDICGTQLKKNNKKICSYCGAEALLTDNFCMRCGTRLI